MNEHQGIRVGVKAVIVREGQILLIGYDLDDGYGFHYNLPGGGVERGEGLREALRREVQEEAGAEVEVGRLLFVTEYVPARHDGKYGPVQSLTVFFRCVLRPGSEPGQPQDLVDAQEGVSWLPLSELPHAPLLPNIGAQIQAVLADGVAEADPFLADWR